MHDITRLRLIVQGVIALGVLGSCTYLGVTGVLDSEAISVLYGAALGAVGAGAVGGVRANTPTNGNGTAAPATPPRP